MIWSSAGIGPSNNGMSIADGRVYWATGPNLIPFDYPTILYCFGLPDE